MNRRMLCLWLAGVAVVGLVVAYSRGIAQTRTDQGAIKLVVRADDIGSCHAANLACIKCYQEGIVKSVEVQVCCPWFNEAVKMLRENPGLDVGVHLTLTSEWENYKWGPITQAPSLVDAQGHFYPQTSQRPDFPPNTGFLESGWRIDEVEKELRAQIELARKMIPQVSHLSSHMNTPTSTPQLQALVQKLAAEYKLPIETPGAQYLPWATDSKLSAEQREAALVKVLEGIGPGTWIVIEHPGLDTPEMQAMGHKGYWEVASHRDGVTKSYTSSKVKETIKNRGIQLVSYHDIWPPQP